MLSSLLIFVFFISQGLIYASGCPPCTVVAQTESGLVCGIARKAVDGSIYASFRGVPYAQQPLGIRRFQELKPPDHWTGCLNAITEGPVCPQKDVLYGKLAKHQGMNESCIHANIHVPINALPRLGQKNPGLPILVMIHGGALSYGSGDSDLQGPEYIVSKGVILITFNYRLNVFGFLDLDTAAIPGNNGIRDGGTLLKWVKRNAEYFGGNPDEVTAAGQSAGSCIVHHLSLSKAGEGLFKRMILMSGLATLQSYSISSEYAAIAAKNFVQALGIDSNDTQEIHDRLVELDIDKIMNAYVALQDQYGINVFAPVLEGRFAGMTPIIDEETVKQLQDGRGRNISALIGFTSKEGEFFRRRYEEINIVDTINTKNSKILQSRLLYKLTTDEAKALAAEVKKRYSSGKNITLDAFLNFRADSYFVRPAMKLANLRAALGFAPTYLYEFSYNSDNSVIKKAMNLNYTGATHVEDLTYVFKENAILGETNLQGTDADMRDWMTDFVVNFIKYGNPAPKSISCWPAADAQSIKYQNISKPGVCNYVEATMAQKQMVAFLDQYDRI